MKFCRLPLDYTSNIITFVLLIVWYLHRSSHPNRIPFLHILQILVGMGLLNMGSFIHFISHPGMVSLDLICLDFISFYFIVGYQWYDMIYCDMITYDVMWDGMISYDIIWYHTIWYNITWYDMMWYDMTWDGMMW